MATQRKATSKAPAKSATKPEADTKPEAEAEADTEAEVDTEAKADADTEAPSQGTGGRVVEEIDKTMVAVYPAAKTGDYEALAKELIEAAEYPSQVETRSMPKRFVVPTKIAKAIGLA